MSQAAEIVLDLTPEEQAQLDKAAEQADETPEEYVRIALAFRQSAENGRRFGSFIEGSQ